MDNQHMSIRLFNPSNIWCKLHEVTAYQNKPTANCKFKMASSLKFVLFHSVLLGINWAYNLLNFEDLILKVSETIYLSHFYISNHLTQIQKALFIYHIHLFQKVLVSTMSWCNSIFWKFQSLVFVSIFIHDDDKNCAVCSVGMFYTVSFRCLNESSSRMLFNNLARVLFNKNK